MREPLRRAAGRRAATPRSGSASSATTRPTSRLVAYVSRPCMAGIAGALFVPIVGIISPATSAIVPVDRVPDRGGDRRPGHAARAGARRDRGGLGADDAVGDVPVGLDLLPGPAVHRRRRASCRAGSRRCAALCAAPAARTAAPDPPTAEPRPRSTRPRSPTPTASRRGMNADYLELRDLHVDFDGFVAVDGVDLTVLAGRPAVPHRTQRRGQDHADRRHHRAGAGHRVGPVRRARAARAEGAPDRPARRRPHLPDRDACSRSSRVLQNLDIAAGAAAARWTLLRRRPGVPDEVAQALETIGLTDLRDVPAGHPRRTARSSGWRSACCWCRTRSCCCSTSRSPA